MAAFNDLVGIRAQRVYSKRVRRECYYCGETCHAEFLAEICGHFVCADFPDPRPLHADDLYRSYAVRVG